MRRSVKLLALAATVIAWGLASPVASKADVTSGPDGQVTVAVNSQPLTPASAPADEYFGRLKLSNLGIKNIIRAFRVEGNSPLALPMQRARIEAVDSAIFDWGNRYPRDPWLAGAILGFADVLAVKHDPSTDSMAIDLLLQLSQRNVRYAKTAIKLLRTIRPTMALDWTTSPIDPPSYPDLIPIAIKLK